ncbi:hypothetical protein ATO12_22790 [Aquimarina atlantica]|uniref:NADP-dependent oxidoreductase domain-containing protein n=1 Tax=Aquimarina atlantica TaxID=1317122 RepID=A0A023BQE4_9FLAO|nr:aldo/keto reductase [Aquimarina atlantica]EZH72282.1 hypothetical protein ATO12_22790 [Aquimarina atlantica]
MESTQKLILGTVQFGLEYGINNKIGKPSKERVYEILNYAFENNINTLDTAEAYGNAHEVIADYHKNNQNRFEIISKYKKDIIGLDKNILKRVEDHLKVLDINSLRGYFFHDFHDFIEYVGKNEIQIKKLLMTGLVKKIGVSVYTNEQLETLLDFDFIQLVQVPFNLFDNAFQREKVLKRIHEKGIEIHTRSAFLQGLFFKTLDSLPSKFDSIRESLHFIQNVCKEKGFKMEQLALNYPLSKKYIDQVLIGVDNLEQLKSNLHSVSKTISSKVFDTIDAIQINEEKLLNPSNW